MINRMLKNKDRRIDSEKRAVTEKFLYWLRSKSQQYQGKIRIVLAGSIGLQPVLKQAGLTASVNNFTPFQLDPWDEQTAIECIEKLANNYKFRFEREAPKRMTEKLGCCIPQHVQMYYDSVEFWCKKKNIKIATSTIIEQVYLKEMLGTRGHAALTDYEIRLQDVMDPDLFPFALDMLTIAAINGILTPSDLRAIQKDYNLTDRHPQTVQNEILDVLQHDGYLEQTDKGYRFISKLLCDWWDRKNRDLFTPIKDR